MVFKMEKNFAIVGCGRIGQRHAEQASKVGKLKAICDILPERANAVGAIYGATPYYSIDELLNWEKELDLLSICTPNGLHASHAIKALQGGIHVLSEKPLCISVADGREMINAAYKANKSLFVVKQNRYNPPVAYLKELINMKKLGTLFSFQVNCFWNRPPSYYKGWKGTKDLDGGTLFTQFSHFIDLIYWLLGDIEQVKYISRNYAHPGIELEDSGVVLFEMKNGSIGSLNYSVNSFEKNMEGSITLIAEKGTIKIGGQYLNELEYFVVEGMDFPNLPAGNPANSYGLYEGSMSNHDKVYQNLVKALDDHTHSFASAEEGLKTVEIIERIYHTGSLLS